MIRNKKKKESTHTSEEVWKAIKEVVAIQKGLAEDAKKMRQFIKNLSKELEKNSKETQEKLKKNSKETQGKLEKSSRETQEKLEKSSRETQEKLERNSRETRKTIEKHSRETANNINKSRGDWDNRWGGFVETLIADNVERLFEDYGIIKGEVETVNKRIYRSIDGIAQFEFDSITINGDKVIITEAKNKMTKPKVNDFVKKVQKFLAIKNNEFSNKKVYIAIGYLKAENEKLLIKHAEKLGLFVIKAIGDSAKLVNSSQTFSPKQLNLNV